MAVDGPEPAAETLQGRPQIIRGVSLLLGASMAAVAAAPVFMPDGYSWIANTISESGAQGIDRAWVARAGVATAGVAVMMLVLAAGDLLPATSRLAFFLYALALFAAVAFPEKPWFEGSEGNLTADLHTAAAFLAGLCFAVGVIALSPHRSPTEKATRLFDTAMVGMIVTIPPLMLLFVSYEGLLQRILVVMGYAWLFLETSRIRQRVGTPQQRGGDRARSGRRAPAVRWIWDQPGGVGRHSPP